MWLGGSACAAGWRPPQRRPAAAAAVQLPVLLLLMVMLAGKGAGALRCWSCGSDTVPACRDPFEPRELQGPNKCVGPPPLSLALSAGNIRPVCTKAVVKLNEVEMYVYRACDWVREGRGAFCEHLAQVLPAHADVRSCLTCVGDGCNAARRLLAAPRLLLALLPALCSRLFVQ